MLARERHQPHSALAWAVNGLVDRVASHRRGRLHASDLAKSTRTARQPGRWLIGAVLAGTLLNPLNSSMITVALLLIQSHNALHICLMDYVVRSTRSGR
jgi:hypothetical protein